MSSSRYQWFLFGAWYSDDASENAVVPLSMNVNAEDTESTSGTDLNERYGFIMPYKGRVKKILTRCELATFGNSKWRIYKASDGTEIPNILVSTSPTINVTAHKTITFPFIGAEIEAGKLLHFKFDGGGSAVLAGDTNFTIVFEFDI